MKTIDFRGDLTDVTVKQEALVERRPFETVWSCEPVLPFQPNYRLAHPKNYLFILSKKIFSGSKYPKNILFNFEKNLNEHDCCQKVNLNAVHNDESSDIAHRPRIIV